MPPDDLYPDMRRCPIDDETAERLLAGAVEPDDAPPGYAQVSGLIQAATAPATAEELVRRDADVSAVTTALVAAPAAASVALEGTRMISRRFGLKALGIAIPALALTATGAAAATGNLPAPAQSAVHNALTQVGLSVPADNTSGDTGDTGDTGNTGTHNANAVGPDATGAAKFGLCRAFIANGGHMSTNSVAFRNLQKAAGSESVASFCAGVTPGNGTSGNTGTSGSDETPSSVPGGKPSSVPPTSTPAGPSTSTPGSDHTSTSTPAGPPTSTPGSDNTSTSTPAGPPTSTPTGRP